MLRKIVHISSILALAMGSASAAPIAVYGVTDAKPGNPDHAIWIPGVERELLFSPNGSFTIDDNDSADPFDDFGLLTGTVYKDGDATKGGFDVNVLFSGISRPGDPGHGAFAAPAKKCCGATAATALNWTFFTNVSGTLSGLNAWSTESLSISRRGPAAQLGANGANDKNLNFGLSSWFWAYSGQNNQIFTQHRYRGDINVDLVSVPEPSTLALLGIGLLGAGLTRRRRRG